MTDCGLSFCCSSLTNNLLFFFQIEESKTGLSNTLIIVSTLSLSLVAKWEETGVFLRSISATLAPMKSSSSSNFAFVKF
jgi:hypothetical protein